MRLRAVDVGCVRPRRTCRSASGCGSSTTRSTELIETHRPTLVGVERLFFSKNAQTAFAVGQARGVVLLAAAQHEVPVREATPNEVKMAVAGYGAADKEQVGRMVATILGLRCGPDAGRRRRRPGRRDLHRQPRARSASRPVPASSTGPRSRRSPAARPPTTAPSARRSRGSEGRGRDRRRSRSRPGDRLGRGRRRGDRQRLARRRGRRDRLPGVRVARGPVGGTGRWPAQALHAPPRPRGPAGAVRLPHRRGARLLRAAPDGHRRRAQGRPGDRRAAGPCADLQLAIIEQDQAVLVCIPGIGKKLAERIIFELKEKVAAAGVAARSAAGAGGPARERGRGRPAGARLLARARRARRPGRRSPSPARPARSRGPGQGGAPELVRD